MKITVITVCLNSVDTIERAIKSVIGQTYSKLEYIVVDGGSTDGTLDVLNRYNTSIDRMISEPDRGIFDAMNKGIELSTGDVIAFLNSDDWYEKDAIEMVMNAFMQGDFDCICCDNYVEKKDGDIVYYNATGKSSDDIYFRMIYFHSAIFCRREFFKKKGNFNLKYKIAADYDWFLKATIQGIKIGNIHKPVFTFCYGGISSANEIDCAREARQIAIEQLPAGKEVYKERIDERFYDIMLRAADQIILRTEMINILGEDRKIILWGAGQRGEQCAKWFQDIGIDVDGVIDSNELYWGKTMRDIKICCPNILENKLCDVIITPDNHVEEIKGMIKKVGNKGNNIFELRSLCRVLAGNLEMILQGHGLE